jgi:hypothetical protein
VEGRDVAVAYRLLSSSVGGDALDGKVDFYEASGKL